MLPQETERLTFKELTEDDFAAVHTYASDPDVSAFMVWGPNTPEDTRRFLAESQAEQLANPRTDWSLGVIRKMDMQLLGACSIHIEDFANKAASIGYTLERGVWGKGYATEAGKAILDFGFRQLGMHRIWATCRPDNTASANVLRKIGMRREGYLRHHVLLRGQWQDSFLFAALADK